MTGFLEANVEHLYRPAAVLIKKPLLYDLTRRRLLRETIREKGSIDYSVFYQKEKDAYEARREEYSEFFNTGILKEQKTKIEDNLVTTSANDPFCKDTDGLYILGYSPFKTFGLSGQMSFAGVEGTNLDVETIGTKYTNKDVMSVDVRRTVSGTSTATITLKNVNNKYTFSKDEFKQGEVIFEPNDEITIYLPDNNGDLKTSFKGLVNIVSKTNDKGFNSITLECECNLKKLRISRTNLQPSLSAMEADYNAPQAFQFPPKYYNDLPGFILSLAVLGLSNIYTEVETSPAADIYVELEGSLPLKVSPTLETYIKNSENVNTMQVALTVLVDYLIPKFISTFAVGTSKTPIKEGYVPLNDPDVKKAIEQDNTIIYVVYKESSKKTPVFTFFGTAQPGAQLSFSLSNFYYSGWETNLSVFIDLAQRFNFNLYTHDSGCVYLSPPNLSFYRLNEALSPAFSNATENFIPTASFDRLSKSSPYYISRLSNVSLESVKDDSFIINWLPMSGNWANFPGMEGNKLGNLAIIMDTASIEKYGWRLEKEKIIVGIDDVLALSVYGRSLMTRQNKKLRAASLTILGNSDITVDNLLYTEDDNTLYYIESIGYSYTSGGSFIMKIRGSWGRKPLIKLSLINVYGDIDSVQILNDLDALYADNKIHYMTYIKYKYSLDHNQSSFSDIYGFLGYVWEDVDSVIFEDVYKVQTAQVIAKLSGEFKNNHLLRTIGSGFSQQELLVEEQKLDGNLINLIEEIVQQNGTTRAAASHLPNLKVIREMASSPKIKV